MKGLSPQTQIEAQIGFLIGIMVGALSAWTMIMFFTPWEWYFKLFATIGEVGIIGSLGMALAQTIGQRRQYLDAKKQMDDAEDEEVKEELDIEDSEELEKSDIEEEVEK